MEWSEIHREMFSSRVQLDKEQMCTCECPLIEDLFTFNWLILCRECRCLGVPPSREEEPLLRRSLPPPKPSPLSPGIQSKGVSPGRRTLWYLQVLRLHLQFIQLIPGKVRVCESERVLSSFPILSHRLLTWPDDAFSPSPTEHSALSPCVSSPSPSALPSVMSRLIEGLKGETGLFSPKCLSPEHSTRR